MFTLIAVPCLLNVVIGGIEVGRDVLCVHICHCHLQVLETSGHLQVFWVVVNADDPTTIMCPSQSIYRSECCRQNGMLCASCHARSYGHTECMNQMMLDNLFLPR